jgi:uncharacterized protein involved in exopolysaccharide biosynthesis
VRELYAIFLRQKRVFAAVFLGTVVLLGLVLVLQTPQFESTALLLVKVGRELIYTPEVGDQPSVSSRDKTTVINSELAIMRAEPVIAGVVKSIGLANLYPISGRSSRRRRAIPRPSSSATSSRRRRPNGCARRSWCSRSRRPTCSR